MIDLHTHTTSSDGTLTPIELMKAARLAGVTAIAVTDHDTVAALDLCMETAEGLGLRVIPGIEVNAHSQYGSLHVLGYFLDHRDPDLHARLVRLRAVRHERNLGIIGRLKALGVAIEYEEVIREAGNGSVGRPHFARALIRKGMVDSTDEAFQVYLRDGGPAYVERSEPSAGGAIDLIHASGGLAVLAHPHRFHLPDPELTALIDELVADGLDGVECFYSDYSAEFTGFLSGVCEARGLVKTGGSDFHGENKPRISLGVGRGTLNIPEEVLAPLEARWRERQRHAGRIVNR